MAKITPKIRTVLLIIFLTGSYITSYANYPSSFLNFLDIEYEGDSIVVPASLNISKIPSLNDILKSPVFIDNPVENKISQLFANHSLKTRIQNKILRQNLTKAYFKFPTYLFTSFSTAPCDDDTGNPTITTLADVIVNVNPGTCSATGVAFGASTPGDNCTVASVINNAGEPFAVGARVVTRYDGKLFKKILINSKFYC